MTDIIFMCSDDGQLRYRGTVHDRGLFVRLRALFAEKPEQHELAFIDQIDAAFRKHDHIHIEEAA
jgi:hypothetical protein